jgi:hypothetical protein
MADNFFVGIKDSTAIRKDLLLVMRDSLELLKQEQLLKDIKTEKLAAAEELKKELDALAKLSRKLRAKLPKVALKKQKFSKKQAEQETHAAAEEKPAAKAKTERKPAGKSKLQLLEEELAAVEQKLKEIA